jgi:radical SAM protein with 4Fe4S-binding SPASM domain
MATFNQKLELFNGLLRGNKAINGPFYVDIDLTERCNLNCLGCPYHNADKKLIRDQKEIPQDMPLEVLNRICTELHELGAHTLIFQGTGEPFLHPHLIDCVRIGKELGFYIILFTNGTLLSADTIQALSDARLDTLKISLWATSEEQFLKNYPGSKPEIFHRIMDGLKLLGDFKSKKNSHFPAIQIHLIFNNTNFQSVNEILDLAARAGSSFISFSPMVNFREELDPLLLSPEQTQEFQKSLLQAKNKLTSIAIAHNIDEIFTRLKLGHSVWKELPCYVTWYHSRIRADGTVQPCGRCTSQIEFGNVNTNSFKNIWNGPSIRNFRTSTKTTKGLATLKGRCNCQYCCFVKDNKKIHRFMRWLSPFAALRRSMGDEKH